MLSHQAGYASMPLCAESKLTGRSQTTIPAAICEALQLKPGEYIRYELRPDGQVLLSRQDDEEALDPGIASFLHFIQTDMQQNPQRLCPLAAEKLARARELTAGMDLRLDTEITDDD